MTKKALLVGVRTYAPVGEDLEAPVNEMNAWADLLSRHYGFSDITRLPDVRAGHDAVLAAFRALVRGATADDQLVFYFGGHGTMKFNVATNELEEAIVAYPGRGDLNSACITDADLENILREESVPLGTDLTFIADCCCSGGLFDRRPGIRGDEVPAGATLLFIPPVIDLTTLFRQGNRPRIRYFGLLERLTGTAVERPIVLAACERFRRAFEWPIDGQKRLVFSARALERLNTNARALERAGEKPEERGDTFDSVLAAIKPLYRDLPQIPELQGNLARRSEVFPGRPRNPTSKTHSGSETSPSPGPIDSLGTVKQGGAMSSIDILFKGICCFVDARNGSDPFKKRVVLPYDNMGGTARHIPFIEIAEDDLINYNGWPPKSEPHQNGTTLFHRWELSGHTIRFLEADPQEALETTTSYDWHVPQIHNLVARELELYPKAECFSDRPDATVIAGYVDLNCGTLVAGPREEASTIFRRQSGEESPWGDRRTPLFVMLRMPLPDDILTIQVQRYPNLPGLDAEIFVKSSGLITIGNLLEADISGPGSGHNPHHFLMYYRLSDMVLADPPLPVHGQAPVNACSVTNWP